MSLRLVPLREEDVQEACQFIVEGREWSPKHDTFLPPMAVLAAHDSRWMSALNEGMFIGVVGFHNISWPDGSAEMFTGITSTWRGSGASLSVVKAQLDYGFLDLGLRRITMTTLAGSPSAKIADKMKVPLEGTFKRARLKRGVYHDAVAYGLERDK